VAGIDECLLEAMQVPGALGVSVVDWTSGLSLGNVGDAPHQDPDATAAETAELARMAAEHPAFVPDEQSEGGTGKQLPVEDVIVTTRTAYHVLRFVETTFDSSVFFHLWLDRDLANLAMARLRLRDLAERLVLG
jgi:hypothetical protein